MKMLFIRGGYLNQFEAQNIESLAKECGMVGIASMRPMHDKFVYPIKQFWSPYDVGDFFGNPIDKVIKVVANRTIGDAHYLFGFERWIKQTGPYDIAHIADTHYGFDMQAIRLKKQGYIKKIVSTCWETIACNNETVTQKKKLKEYVKKSVDIFICPTERAKKALITEGVNEKKIQIIRIGVDLQKFKPKKAPLKKNIRLLFVGRLVPEKGINDLLELHDRLIDKNPDIKIELRVIGDGPLRKIVKKIALEHNYAQIPQEYQSSDILIVPSHTTTTWEEQYGMVLVEAMACGLPIVAYDSGAIGEVLGNGGITVDEGNVGQMSFVVQSLIDDKYMRFKFGQIGRARAVEQFDANKIAQKIKQLYKSITVK